MAEYFDQVLRSFNGPDKNRILEILEIWATFPDWADYPPLESCNHHRIIANLKNEHFLKDSDFYDLLNKLNKNYAGDIAVSLLQLRSQIFSTFLKKGDLVEKNPIYVGTTVAKQSFYTFVESKGYLPSDIDRLIGKAPDKLTTEEKLLILKDPFKLVWLTWDEKGKEDPFAFLGAVTSNNAFTAFALDDYYKGQELISFCFRLDRSIADFLIFRPTWCDATFFDKFHPTDPNLESKWGLTFPESTYPVKDDYEYRRPEGVINADNLILEFLHTPITILPL
nr:hypothetical protein [Mucilaginibacter sp. L294]